jgi:hypothetical protein
MILILTAYSAAKVAIDTLQSGPADWRDAAALLQLWSMAHYVVIAVLALRVRDSLSTLTSFSYPSLSAVNGLRRRTALQVMAYPQSD